MRTLVTGADGFVGEHVLTALLEREGEVAASALTLPPTRSTLTPDQMAAVDWKAADVRDHDALFRVLAAVQPDRIYHLAGFSSGALAREQAEEAVRINAGGTVNLCEAVLSVRQEFPDFDPRILVMGSGDSYGDAGRPGEPLREDLMLRPVTVYGLSKACQELAAHTYRRAHGVRTVVARGFNLVGPGQGRRFVVPDFCAQVRAIADGEREPRLEVGNVDVERDFTDVRDGVDAFMAVMDLQEPQAAYNVCSGRAVPVRRLLEWILDEAGVDAEVAVAAERVRSEEPRRVVGDPSRIREETGWEPRRSLEETIREVYRSTGE
ncbi:MAG TPA: GDP-mannose 4,6-dehydratase [Gemmatimonadota bacterium]|nr:GDP-mannose 4,6-dehydratase [Gemmatimonadota bacterium]